MKRIFIDTNILLDLVMKRHSFYQEAKRLFDYCEQRNIKTYISAISIATINYLLSKSFRKDEVKQFDNIDQMMENGPEVDRNMFKIPKVL